MLDQEQFRVQRNGIAVTLVAATDHPYDLSVAAARTCYSAKGPVAPEDVSRTDRARQLRDRIAGSTFKAGHLTTRQHAHFTFILEGVSRQLIWGFLHAHTQYNSEQVSQRYVPVEGESYYRPPELDLPRDGSSPATEAGRIYLESIEQAKRTYHRLIELLTPTVRDEFFRIFPGRKKDPERWEGSIQKKAMEAARYVLPVATTAYLYHTISQLTLYRYYKLKHRLDLSTEAVDLIDLMVELAHRFDPDLVRETPDPTPLEQTPEYTTFQALAQDASLIDTEQAKGFVESFDRVSGGSGQHRPFSHLVSWTQGADRLLETVARSRYGLPGIQIDSAVSADVEITGDGPGLSNVMPGLMPGLLSAEYNPTIASTMGEAFTDPTGRFLEQVHFTFQKKISHTADSQDQRHRATPGVRPLLLRHYTGEADYITPDVISQTPRANEVYEEFMREHFERIQRFVHTTATEPSIPQKLAVYLLPNAFPIRLYQSGSLFGWAHRFRTRSCYNAQEEIFTATLQEIAAVESAVEGFRGYFRAPCTLRKQAGINPPCPEGDRFCGVRVWELSLEQYHRLI